MMQEEKILEIKTRKKLMDIYFELQKYNVEQMFLVVDKDGSVHIEYLKASKKQL
jgi:hypothetical protein